MSDSDPLIEHTRVPELEVLALQQQLNQRVRAGLLSGPLLRENGRLDEETLAKQREQEAVDMIALASLDPERPADPAAHAAAHAEDEALLAELQGHLAAIPDTPYLDFDHKGPSVARVQALAAAVERKWRVVQASPSRLEPPIEPGGLVWEDGAFDYPALEAALARLRHAEEGLAGTGPDLAGALASYRRQIVAGLQPGPASRRRKKADGPSLPPEAPPAGALPPVTSAPATGPLGAPAGAPTQPIQRAPAFVPDPERARQGRELDILGPERRRAMLRDAAAQHADDPRLAPLAASLARTHPEGVTPGLVGFFDAYACLEASQDEGRLTRIPPAARAGMLKVLAGRSGEGPEALFTATGASLLRQHPQAAQEVLAQVPDARRGPLAVAMIGRLTDDEVSRLGRDTLHQLAKQLQAGSAAEERRQLARLVRLMGRR